MSRWNRILIAGLIVLIVPLAAVAGSAGQAAEPIGSDACLQCHDAMAHTQARHKAVACVSCHGGAAAHLEDPSTLPTKPDAAACLACHRKSGAQRMNWDFGDHARAELQCRDCHGIHTAKVVAETKGAVQVKDARAALCLSCHVEIAPRLNMMSHHPIREGALSCVSCHDPHGGDRTKLEGVTATCTRCHQAVRGPHTFEHVPAVESCLNCHNPHGSPNRALLQVAQPMLCLQCHSLADNRHGQTGSAGARIGGAALRSCTSCHSALHGSSFDEHLRF